MRKKTTIQTDDAREELKEIAAALEDIAVEIMAEKGNYTVYNAREKFDELIDKTKEKGSLRKI